MSEASWPDGGDPYEAARVRLHQLLLSGSRATEVLTGVCRVAADAMRGDVTTSVTLIRDGRPTTVAYGDPRAEHVDELQYASGDGPCLTAARTASSVHVQDFSLETRWGAFPVRVMEAGFYSSLSTPMRPGADAVGALNIYAVDRDAFDADDVQRARWLGEEAERVVELALKMADDAEVRAQLEAALTSRSVIDQALGIIMGQNQCSAEAAFRLLRDASQNRNVKLRELAASMVASVSKGQPPSSAIW
jgi:hypothetical protein